MRPLTPPSDEARRITSGLNSAVNQVAAAHRS